MTIGADRALQRAAQAVSSWKLPLSYPRAASHPRTRGSGRTPRSHRSSGSSTLLTRRERKLVSSSRTRAARRRLSHPGSSRAQIAPAVRTHRLRLPTKTDGQRMVLFSFFICDWGSIINKVGVVCSLWACRYALVEGLPDSQGDDRNRFAVRRRRIYSSH